MGYAEAYVRYLAVPVGCATRNGRICRNPECRFGWMRLELLGRGTLAGHYAPRPAGYQKRNANSSAAMPGFSVGRVGL